MLSLRLAGNFIVGVVEGNTAFIRLMVGQDDIKK